MAGPPHIQNSADSPTLWISAGKEEQRNDYTFLMFQGNACYGVWENADPATDKKHQKFPAQNGAGA